MNNVRRGLLVISYKMNAEDTNGDARLSSQGASLDYIACTIILSIAFRQYVRDVMQ